MTVDSALRITHKECKGKTFSCGELKPLTAEYFYPNPNTKTGFESRCLSCRKLMVTEYKLRKRNPATPDGQIALLVERARHRHDNVTVDYEWVHRRMLAVGGKCERTGIDFVFTNVRNHPHQLSLDQIDPGKGYTEDNCQLVVNIYNRMKNEWHDDDCTDAAIRLLRNLGYRVVI